MYTILANPVGRPTIRPKNVTCTASCDAIPLGTRERAVPLPQPTPARRGPQTRRARWVFRRGQDEPTGRRDEPGDTQVASSR